MTLGSGGFASWKSSFEDGFAECSSQRLPDSRQHCRQNSSEQRWLAVRVQLGAQQAPAVLTLALRAFLLDSASPTGLGNRERFGEPRCE